MTIQTLIKLKGFPAPSSVYGKGVYAADFRPGLIDAAPAILQEHTGIVCVISRVHQEDGVETLQHIRVGIAVVHILYIFHLAPFPQAAGQVEGVQRFYHDLILHIPAAVAAEPAVEGYPVLGAH